MNQHMRQLTHPVHRHRRAAPPARQIDRRGGGAGADALPVHQRSGSDRAGGRPRGFLRRQACRDLRQRHRCAADGADGQEVGRAMRCSARRLRSARPAKRWR